MGHQPYRVLVSPDSAERNRLKINSGDQSSLDITIDNKKSPEMIKSTYFNVNTASYVTTKHTNDIYNVTQAHNVVRTLRGSERPASEYQISQGYESSNRKVLQTGKRHDDILNVHNPLQMNLNNIAQSYRIGPDGQKQIID